MQAKCVELLQIAQSAFAAGDFTSAILPFGFTELVLTESALEQRGKRPPAPAASVVIASYRNEPNLAAALSEVARQIREVNAEVILVNNGNSELENTASLALNSFLTITPPMQAGCSLARNIGALAARGKVVIFLDDDGLLEVGSLQALTKALEQFSAIAVRGKVVPLTNPQLTAPHYDLGDTPTTSLITAEGISIWKRNEFLMAGGFDPLLAGHEGLALSWKLWKFYGPHSMIYEPRAVLYHDFATSKVTSEAKKQRHKQNYNYLAINAPRASKLHETRLKHENHLRETILNVPAVKQARKQKELVSIICTVKNGMRWMDDFTRSWKHQSYADFQLVVVDDGSLDGTANELAARWKEDSRLTLVQETGKGRGAALNTAINHAHHDLCIIADFDDISIPERIDLTEAHFTQNPACDWMSFVAYTEDNHYRIGFPTSLEIKSLTLRSLFGMPASFPATAFRKSRFTQEFNPGLRAGVDCDWVRRNLEANPNLQGELVQRPVVYYRIHDGQLSAVYQRQQMEARSALIEQCYSRIIGPLSDDDRKWIKVLSDNLEINPEEKRSLTRWMASLLQQNNQTQAFPSQELGLLMQQAFQRIKIHQPTATIKPTTVAAKPAAVPTSSISVQKIATRLNSLFKRAR
jgi:glycosyltransferase involved in cell wall biosynthesis